MRTLNIADTGRLLLKQLRAVAKETGDRDDEILAAATAEVVDAILARNAIRVRFNRD